MTDKQTNETIDCIFASKYGFIGKKINEFMCLKNKKKFENCIANNALDCTEFFIAYKKSCLSK